MIDMSATTTQTPGPSPLLFFDNVTTFHRTAAVKAAVELGLFTAIGEGKQTAPEVAESCGAAERGIRILCDCLVVMGLLAKEKGTYRLTQDSAVFLDKR